MNNGSPGDIVAFFQECLQQAERTKAEYENAVTDSRKRTEQRKAELQGAATPLQVEIRDRLANNATREADRKSFEVEEDEIERKIKQLQERAKTIARKKRDCEVVVEANEIRLREIREQLAEHEEQAKALVAKQVEHERFLERKFKEWEATQLGLLQGGGLRAPPPAPLFAEVESDTTLVEELRVEKVRVEKVQVEESRVEKEIQVEEPEAEEPQPQISDDAPPSSPEISIQPRQLRRRRGRPRKNVIMSSPDIRRNHPRRSNRKVTKTSSFIDVWAVLGFTDEEDEPSENETEPDNTNEDENEDEDEDAEEEEEDGEEQDDSTVDGQSSRPETGTPTRSIEFDDVYQNGKPKIPYIIEEFPKSSGEWYIFRCEEHGLHFGSSGRSPILGAGRHIDTADHGHPGRAGKVVVKALGVRVLNCTEDKAILNNSLIARPVDKRTKAFKETRPSKALKTPTALPYSKQRPGSTFIGSVTNPIAGHVYSIKKGYPSAVLLLALGDLEHIGVEGSLHTTSFARCGALPSCFQRHDERLLWANGFEDNGPRVSERQYPVLFFNRETCFSPEGLLQLQENRLEWRAAQDLQPLDPFNVTGRVDGVAVAREFCERVMKQGERRPRDPATEDKQPCKTKGPSSPQRGLPVIHQSPHRRASAQEVPHYIHDQFELDEVETNDSTLPGEMDSVFLRSMDDGAAGGEITVREWGFSTSRMYTPQNPHMSYLSQPKADWILPGARGRGGKHG
ncbi:hypothetical protein OQA88_1091 [Cercophora sp. LCS_1]